MNAHVAPQNLVLRLGVARELDPADAELLALVDVNDHIRDLIGPFHDLRLDLREKMARIRIELPDRLQTFVDYLGA